MIAWGAKVSREFLSKASAIAYSLGVDPSWLMAIIAFESGRTFSASARNQASGATGLIQFMPATARALGTSTDALAAMTPEQQLEYVAAYFRPYIDRIKSFADLYMAVLWPAGIGKRDDEVIFFPGSQTFLQNRGLDINHDGAVTKAEAAAFPAKLLDEGMQPGNALELDTQPAAPIEDRSTQYTPQGSKPMPVLALLSAFGPLLQTLIPQIASLFTPKGEVAQRNVKLAKTLVSTITGAAGQSTLEGAVQAMQQSDDVKQAVQRAVVTHPDIMSELQMVETGSGGIGGAREANVALVNAPEARWWASLLSPVMFMSIALCTMLIMVLGNVLGMPWGGSFQSWSENTRSNVVFAVITGALGAITGYWFGTTVQSNKKDSIIAAQADASRATT